MTDQLTPKFLTEEVVIRAIDAVTHLIFQSDESPIDPKRDDYHVVVIVPSVEDARKADYPKFPNYPVTPYVLYEDSGGDVENWEHPYDNIARCKGMQLWRGMNDDGNMGVNAHLLFPDDTPYWGGVYRHGIVVCCSGIQPWFDQLISGMVADMIKAMAHDAFVAWQAENVGVDFLD